MSIVRLPPDVRATRVTTPLTEVHDWSIKAYGIEDAWRENRGTINGKPVRAAVLDCGIDVRHPDLKDAIHNVKDFSGSMHGWNDGMGHGTWCASMLGARADNNLGVAGIAPLCELVICKVLGDSGGGTDEMIYAGLQWALKQGASFFSMSLGGPQMNSRLRSLCREIVSTPGHFLFAAAGNDGAAVNFPAAWPEFVAVGAVDKQQKLTEFTSRGPELDVLGPGVDMLGCVPGGYATMSGTSMACPFCCGVGILTYAKHAVDPGPTPIRGQADMLEHLKRHSAPLGEYGLIDPKKLLADNGGAKPPAAPGDGGEWGFRGVKVHVPARSGDRVSIGFNW